MNEKKKDVKKKRREKKRRIKAHPHPHPDQLRNYEAGHTYGGLKIDQSNYLDIYL